MADSDYQMDPVLVELLERYGPYKTRAILAQIGDAGAIALDSASGEDVTGRGGARGRRFAAQQQADDRFDLAQLFKREELEGDIRKDLLGRMGSNADVIKAALTALATTSAADVGAQASVAGSQNQLSSDLFSRSTDLALEYQKATAPDMEKADKLREIMRGPGTGTAAGNLPDAAFDEATSVLNEIVRTAPSPEAAWSTFLNSADTPEDATRRLAMLQRSASRMGPQQSADAQKALRVFNIGREGYAESVKEITEQMDLEEQEIRENMRGAGLPPDTYDLIKKYLRDEDPNADVKLMQTFEDAFPNLVKIGSVEDAKKTPGEKLLERLIAADRAGSDDRFVRDVKQQLISTPRFQEFMEENNLTDENLALKTALEVMRTKRAEKKRQERKTLADTKAREKIAAQMYPEGGAAAETETGSPSAAVADSSPVSAVPEGAPPEQVEMEEVTRYPDDPYEYKPGEDRIYTRKQGADTWMEITPDSDKYLATLEALASRGPGEVAEVPKVRIETAPKTDEPPAAPAPEREPSAEAYMPPTLPETPEEGEASSILGSEYKLGEIGVRDELIRNRERRVQERLEQQGPRTGSR